MTKSLKWWAQTAAMPQVAGYKYVRLYAPDQTARLYVGDAPANAGSMSGVQAARLAVQRNTSPIDVAAPDLARFPDFARAVYTEAVLQPGELLFIPVKTWHYVRSLTTAISVNFWF
jgi:lysine-specific demethylase 8